MQKIETTRLPQDNINANEPSAKICFN